MHGTTIKMGRYSGGNHARDFLRVVKPPVASWVLLSTLSFYVWVSKSQEVPKYKYPLDTIY